MMLSVIFASLSLFHGNDTSHTERLAAGLLLDKRIEIRASPEIWIGLKMLGIAFKEIEEVIQILSIAYQELYSAKHLAKR